MFHSSFINYLCCLLLDLPYRLTVPIPIIVVRVIIVRIVVLVSTAGLLPEPGSICHVVVGVLVVPIE